MGIIYYFSSMPATSSADVSDGLISKAVDVMSNFTNEIGITSYNDQTIANIKTFLDTPVRKLAHFTLYFILEVLVINALLISGIKKKVIIYSLLICLLYAISDEIHQIFIPGRAGMVIDVLIDLSGSFLASNIVYLKIVK